MWRDPLRAALRLCTWRGVVRAVLAALTGEKTLAELAQFFGVHPNQIADGKSRLLAEATAVFDPACQSARMTPRQSGS